MIFFKGRDRRMFGGLDLIPRDNLDKWLKYLRNEFPTLAFRSSTQNQRDRLVCLR